MPLVLSLAMDNALHLTQFYCEPQPCSVRHALVSVGRVVMLTCGVMALLYGTISWRHFPGCATWGGGDLWLAGRLIGAACCSGAADALRPRPALFEALAVEEN